MNQFKHLLVLLVATVLISCSGNDDAPATTAPSIDLLITNMSPTAGPKNTPVTLTGTGFSTISANNIVTINGKNCTIVSNTATQINLLIPPGAGSGKIKVVVGDANAESTVFNFIFTTLVSTFAGSGQLGLANGQGIAAKFNKPVDVAVDVFSNIYVADGDNGLVRKISSSGLVTTFAGSGLGSDNGQGTAASFNGVSGLITDAAGTVYVADKQNHRIRKITPGGLVSTFVGNSAGFIDGSASFARFNEPSALAIDGAGNLYVIDSGNNCIRKITPDGFVVTIAGGTQGFADGLGTVAKFNNPQGLAIDALGNVYVADTFNNRIRKIDVNGLVTTISGTTQGFQEGAVASAKFSNPTDVILDALGNLYISDIGNSRIRKITPQGIVSTLAGNSIQGFADGNANTAQFNLPLGMAIDAQGNLYISDNQNNRIRKIVTD